eukprot:2195504-Prymnesium_polylepis.1
MEHGRRRARWRTRVRGAGARGRGRTRRVAGGDGGSAPCVGACKEDVVRERKREPAARAHRQA